MPSWQISSLQIWRLPLRHEDSSPPRRDWLTCSQPLLFLDAARPSRFRDLAQREGTPHKQPSSGKSRTIAANFRNPEHSALCARRWRHDVHIVLLRRIAAMTRAVLPSMSAQEEWLLRGPDRNFTHRATALPLDGHAADDDDEDRSTETMVPDDDDASLTNTPPDDENVRAASDIFLTDV